MDSISHFLKIKNVEDIYDPVLSSYQILLLL